MKVSLFQKIITVFIVAIIGCATSFGCTSALVGVERGADGRWLLWKHRDSGHPDNYIKKFEATDSSLAYVALFNAADTAAREAWIGFNSAGFAVMNTASYNIPAPAKNWQDREGILMSDALRHCRSINDFHQLLLNYRGKRGVQANFGVFDANGNGAYFETSDENVVMFPLDSIGFSTRTNYSLSGGKENRLGLSRHRAEIHLIDSILTASRDWAPKGKLAAEDFIETLSRSFYLPEKGIDLLDGTAQRYRDNGDVISRRSSCCSVVIEGPLPGEDPAKTMIMWTSIGFPTLSTVEAVTLDSIPTPLLPTIHHQEGETIRAHSTKCDSVNIVREKSFIKNASKPQKTTNTQPKKATFDFNLSYLRKEIPIRRAISLSKYASARALRNHSTKKSSSQTTPLTKE